MLKLIALGRFAFLTATLCPHMLLETARAETPTVKLSAPSTVVAQAAPVTLTVTLVNTTRHEFTFWVAPGRHNAELFYDVIGKDRWGKELVRTEYGKWIHNGPVMMVSRMQKTLKPEESFGETIDASKIFDISRPGQYSFQVKREYLLNEKVDIKSNIVTVEVK